MKRRYVLSASALILLGASSFVAQRPASGTPQRPAGATPQPAATPAPVTSTTLPVSKMAVIDTEAFLDPKNGITRFSAALTKLNGEFQKVKDDITQSQTRAQTLQDEISKLQQASGVVDQRSLQNKNDQLDQLKKDIQRKGEDAQAAFNKRRNELFAPLQEEIGRALEAFAKARGINIVIDASQVPLLYAADSIDITRAFIADFNSKSPSTAATKPPQ